MYEYATALIDTKEVDKVSQFGVVSPLCPLSTIKGWLGFRDLAPATLSLVQLSMYSYGNLGWGPFLEAPANYPVR